MKTKHTTKTIRDLLARNDLAVERAILAIYARQTADEKATSDTRHTNARGFSAAHASRGSYYARWIASGRHLTGVHLTTARELSLHYTRQLLDIAESNVARGAR